MKRKLFAAFLLILTAAHAAESLRPQWEFSTAPHQPQAVLRDEKRPVLYVAQMSGGLLVLDVANATKPVKIAEVARLNLAGLDAMHLWQSGDRIFVALGNFFEASGAKVGLAVVNIKEPRRPQVTGLWTSEKKLNGSAMVLVDGDFAYLAAMSEGVFTFDVSGGKPRLISTIQPDVNFPRPKPNRVQHPNARGLALRENLLFVAYDAGGLRVLDVTDKAAPREISRYLNAALPNKQQAYNNIVLRGSQAFIAVDYCGLEIVDISDPRAIRQVGWWNPWGCEKPTNMWINSPGHTNQIALDVARNLVFLSAGDSDLQVVDVSDPAKPKLAASHGTPRDKTGAWGATLAGDTVYLTYIRALIPFQGNWQGLKALGVTGENK